MPGYGTGILLVLSATVGWSLAGVFVRFLPGLDGWQINCWRGFWMSVFLLAYLVAIYGADTLARFKAIPLLALIATAAFFTAGSTLYVTSLTLAGTATVSVIGALSPIFTGLLSPWITHERPSLASWAAAFMALAGVGVIAWDSISGGNLLGIVVALMVPISFAGQTVTLRRFRSFDMVPAICVGGFATFFIAVRWVTYSAVIPVADSKWVFHRCCCSPSWDPCSSRFRWCFTPGAPRRCRQ